MSAFGISISEIEPERRPTRTRPLARRDRRQDVRQAPEQFGQEEVYVALRGSGTIVADGQELPLDGDHIVRIGPEVTRKISRARRAAPAHDRRRPGPRLRRRRFALATSGPAALAPFCRIATIGREPGSIGLRVLSLGLDGQRKALDHADRRHLPCGERPLGARPPDLATEPDSSFRVAGADRLRALPHMRLHPRPDLLAALVAEPEDLSTRSIAIPANTATIPHGDGGTKIARATATITAIGEA